jgi:hypothetical protein
MTWLCQLFAQIVLPLNLLGRQPQPVAKLQVHMGLIGEAMMVGEMCQRGAAVERACGLAQPGQAFPIDRWPASLRLQQALKASLAHPELPARCAPRSRFATPQRRVGPVEPSPPAGP